MSDYPSEEQLQRIREWDIHDPVGWFDYIQDAGQYWPEDSYWAQEDNTYHISTGGWSGNEDILDAMQENFILWTMTWQEHRRGGHYVFIVQPERHVKVAGLQGDV